MDRLLCPRCGSECEREYVDVGPASIPSTPWGCPNCTWVEGETVESWWVAHGRVMYNVRTEWERATVTANGFKLQYSNVYGCPDTDVNRYVARTIAGGGIG